MVVEIEFLPHEVTLTLSCKSDEAKINDSFDVTDRKSKAIRENVFQPEKSTEYSSCLPTIQLNF